MVQVTRPTPTQARSIGAVLAELRGLRADELARATSDNARRVLPRLAALA